MQGELLGLKVTNGHKLIVGKEQKRYNTYIFVILKIKYLENIKNYRPISLYNVILKLVPIANKLKIILDYTPYPK